MLRTRAHFGSKPPQNLRATLINQLSRSCALQLFWQAGAEHNPAGPEGAYGKSQSCALRQPAERVQIKTSLPPSTSPLSPSGEGQGMMGSYVTPVAASRSIVLVSV